MNNEYKEWLQDQTFETLATDNYYIKLLLLAEQAKNKLEAKRNKSFENVRQLLYSEIKKLSNPNKNFDGIDEMVQQNIELQAKNKKLVEIIERIRNYELQSLDIDWDEYEAQCRETDYSPIITYCEEGLGVFNGV